MTDGHPSNSTSISFRQTHFTLMTVQPALTGAHEQVRE